MKDTILKAAIARAEKDGYATMTRDSVANEAGCATGLINHYWNTMTQLRRAVMRKAVATDNFFIISQGLGARDKQALKASPEAKKKALKLMMG